VRNPFHLVDAPSKKRGELNLREFNNQSKSNENVRYTKRFKHNGRVHQLNGVTSKAFSSHSSCASGDLTKNGVFVKSKIERRGDGYHLHTLALNQR
jgi:hypothetical protein